MYTYLVIDNRGRKDYVQAGSSYEAQVKGALLLKAKKRYDVSVYVVEDDKGNSVIHSPSIL